jgi:signal transduction histidine kinase
MALLKLSSEIRSSHAHVERDHLPNAIGHETELAQVFEHILSNSLKFRSAAAPEIVVSAEQGIAECTITLRDNGLGIDPPFCEQVFLPFKRLHGKSIPGSGLGLAICSKIVRAHKGRIWAESDGRTGTTVRFTLPT